MMNFESVTLNVLLFLGLFLMLIGVFLYFVPKQLIKLNAMGNKWIGDASGSLKRSSFQTRLFSADYAIFANHKIVGRILVGISSMLLIIYVLYQA